MTSGKGKMGKHILLSTQGYEIIVDSDIYPTLNKYRWYVVQGYARRTTDKMALHRFIMNAPKGILVDHINRNPLDNRKENLRLASKSLNAFNSKIHTNNKTGYTGIWYDKTRNNYQVYITKDKKRRCLGRRSDLKEAIKLRKKAEIELY